MATHSTLRDEQYKTSKNLSARANLHRYSTAPVRWFDWLFDRLLMLGLPDNARIVDVGGGPGWFWKHNISRIPAGWEILHTDFSPGMVEEARGNVDEATRAKLLAFLDSKLAETGTFHFHPSMGSLTATKKAPRQQTPTHSD